MTGELFSYLLCSEMVCMAVMFFFLNDLLEFGGVRTPHLEGDCVTTLLAFRS